MSTQIKHFLLVFDHAAGRLVEERNFGSDSDGAVAAYAETETKYQDRKDVEIVLVGSDSIETVKFTHANYFDGTIALSKYLQAALPDYV